MSEEVRGAYYTELWCELNEIMQEIKAKKEKMSGKRRHGGYRYGPRENMCPDCGLLLMKEDTSKRFTCPDSECLVIYVKYARGKPWGRIIKITRAVQGRGVGVNDRRDSGAPRKG